MEANITKPTDHRNRGITHLQVDRKTIHEVKDRSSMLAYQVLVESWDQERIEFVKQFRILFLNSANRILSVCDICIRGVTATYIDITLNGCGNQRKYYWDYSGHNLLSGNLQLSLVDKEIIKKIVKTAQILYVRVLDHIIVTTDEYISFHEEELL